MLHVINVEEAKAASLSAEIKSDMLLELLGSELKYSEWRKPRSEKILRRSGMHELRKGALMFLRELEREGHMSPFWTG